MKAEEIAEEIAHQNFLLERSLPDETLCAAAGVIESAFRAALKQTSPLLAWRYIGLHLALGALATFRARRCGG